MQDVAGGGWVSNEDLYTLYKAWCDAGGVKPVSINELNKHLKEVGFTQDKPRKARNKVTGVKVTKRGYIGMRLDIEEGGSMFGGGPVWEPVTGV